MTQSEAIDAIDRELASMPPQMVESVLRLVLMLRESGNWGLEPVLADESALAGDWLSAEDEVAWAAL